MSSSIRRARGWKVDARFLRLYRPLRQAFIRLTGGPGVQPWTLTYLAAVIYAPPSASANSSPDRPAPPARWSDLLGFRWPSTRGCSFMLCGTQREGTALCWARDFATRTAPPLQALFRQ